MIIYCSQQLMWRDRGKRNTSQNVHERDRYDEGLMVFTDIMHNDRIPLPIFERGTVTWQRYCRAIILDYVRLFRCAVGPNFMCLDNNASTCSTSEVSEH